LLKLKSNLNVIKKLNKNHTRIIGRRNVSPIFNAGALRGLLDGV
jgi:hypothetical protein